ncbi:M16 family metallopeptidase [Helicobacter cetorum]|uniref:Processing zinc-metalloprotease n=1 Tax=Helicobacter cetorum (strain ATCC BAA-540 / CCUG 52418 / MIT 99-5656) TaxID=1163745 RepID=I0ESZ3_HELCM|nr:pitrilysin family protein [Helicobacter cetorum]AFI06062.1 processing zinc-metalloprotease [Helicobacter cetorum MIT 99-5656]
MKKFFIILLLGAIMGLQASALMHQEINQTKVPVIYEENHLLPMGFVHLVFRGGGSLGDKNQLGLAKLFAQILNEGTKELGSVKFAQILEQKAISLSVDSSTEDLQITLEFLKEYEEEAIERLKELLKSPNFTQSALEKVQTRMLAALLQKESDFDYLAKLTLKQELFAKTPLANASLGTKESLQKIKLDDLKQQFSKVFELSKLVVVLGGDLEIKQTLKRLDNALNFLPKGKIYDEPYFETSDKKQEKILYKDTQQAYVYFGAPFKVKDLKQDLARAKVMMFVLGGGFGSRLMEKIRVKEGLAYSVYIHSNLSKTAYFASGYLQTKLSTQAKSVNLVKKIIKEFTQQGITQQELDDAKKFLLGSEPLRNETMSSRLHTKFNHFYLGLPLDFDKTILEQIQKMSLKEINDFIKAHAEINDLTFAIVTNKNLKTPSHASKDN